MSTPVRTTGSAYTSGGDLTRRQLTRAAVAATIGTTIEWFDTTLYGLLIPIALGREFFPAGDPLTSSLPGFVSLLAPFAARPAAGVVFGHYGHRLGPKRLRVATLPLPRFLTPRIGWPPPSP